MRALLAGAAVLILVALVASGISYNTCDGGCNPAKRIAGITAIVGIVLIVAAAVTAFARPRQD
jgi:hypothetical protein